MEDLCLEITNEEDQQLIYRNGPIPMGHANEFMIRFRKKDTQQFVTKIYKLPTAKDQIIISDFNKKIDFSSFLDDDQIMIK